MTHVIRSSFFVAIRLYKSVPLAANITSYDTRMGPGSVQVPITEPFLEPVLRSGDIPRLDPVDPRLAPFGPLLSRAPWDNLPPPPFCIACSSTDSALKTQGKWRKPVSIQWVYSDAKIPLSFDIHDFRSIHHRHATNRVQGTRNPNSVTESYPEGSGSPFQNSQQIAKTN